MDIFTIGLLSILLIVVIFLLLVLIERKLSIPKKKRDWYDTPADDELTPLLGVVSPKKKKGDK